MFFAATIRIAVSLAKASSVIGYSDLMILASDCIAASIYFSFPLAPILGDSTIYGMNEPNFQNADVGTTIPCFIGTVIQIATIVKYSIRK
jgi:hypothetical protein